MSKTVAIATALLALVSTQSGDGLGRERSDDAAKNSAKDAWEGKAPPQLEMELWMNVADSEAFTTRSWSLDGLSVQTNEIAVQSPNWKTLKGKVVLLDFWAYW